MKRVQRYVRIYLKIDRLWDSREDSQNMFLLRINSLKKKKKRLIKRTKAPLPCSLYVSRCLPRAGMLIFFHVVGPTLSLAHCFLFRQTAFIFFVPLLFSLFVGNASLNLFLSL